MWLQEQLLERFQLMVTTLKDNMAKKEEAIFIGIDNERIELIGADKEAFLEQRMKDQETIEASKAQQEAQKELKISAYKKLGLTDEEINAII